MARERERETASFDVVGGLAQIFEHITDSIIVSDAEGRILQWNAGAERVFGYTADEMVGDNVARLAATDYDTAGRLRAISAEGPPVEGVEFAGRHKSGRTVWVHVHTTPIRNADGTVVAFVGVGKDVTERVAQTELLVQRLELERHLIGVVSHDLRNPLNAIVLSVALLERLELPEKARRGVDRISRATQRSLRLIDNLMDFTRARRGDRMHLRVARADLAPLVVSIVDELRPQYADRHIDVEASAAVCEFDDVRMSQVVQNLVNNALQHTSGPAHVRVRVWRDASDGDVRLEVWNDGAPIPPEMLPRLFAPYEQGNSHSTDRSLGLGLFIAREAVSAHGGTISVTSDAEHGTVFAVRLPETLQPSAAPERERL